MKAVIFALALCVLAVSAQELKLDAMPQFPSSSLLEVGATVDGPETNILTGKPLTVPIIEDPFAKATGGAEANELARITQVLTYEPPSAALPPSNAADKLDILEILDADKIAAAKALKAKLAADKVKAAQAAKLAKVKAAAKAAKIAAENAVKIAKAKIIADRAAAAKKNAAKTAGTKAVKADAKKKVEAVKNAKAKAKATKEAKAKSKKDAKAASSGKKADKKADAKVDLQKSLSKACAASKKDQAGKDKCAKDVKACLKKNAKDTSVCSKQFKPAKKSLLEADSEDSDSISMSELKSKVHKLEGLIDRAHKIEAELPLKEQKLQALRNSLHQKALEQAKKIAQAKVDQQAQLLGNVDSKLSLLQEKLAKLSNAKQMLGSSIESLKEVATGNQVDAALIEKLEN